MILKKRPDEITPRKKKRLIVRFNQPLILNGVYCTKKHRKVNNICVHLQFATTVLRLANTISTYSVGLSKDSAQNLFNALTNFLQRTLDVTECSTYHFAMPK